MEMPQHGNGFKSEFGSVSFFFQELSEIPQKLKSVEGFPNILDRFPLYLHLTRFLFFRIRFRFSKIVLNSQFGDRFPLFWGPFPLSWVRFRILIKVLNSQFVD